jgi:hypothetical protein
MDIEMIAKSWKKKSSIKGCVKDGLGNKVYDISGCWTESITITDLNENKEVIWTSPQPIANAPANYNFTELGILLNHFTPDMKGVIAPTDSRLREDQRLFEEGKMDQADKEKTRLEVKQRSSRKAKEERKEEIECPLFFTKCEIKNMFTGKMQLHYELIQGDQGYWARRERKDWGDCPDLF